MESARPVVVGVGGRGRRVRGVAPDHRVEPVRSVGDHLVGRGYRHGLGQRGHLEEAGRFGQPRRRPGKSPTPFPYTPDTAIPSWLRLRCFERPRLHADGRGLIRAPR
jgi:hypothetical protein